MSRFDENVQLDIICRDFSFESGVESVLHSHVIPIKYYVFLLQEICFSQIVL
jgi:hypothetical protein